MIDEFRRYLKNNLSLLKFAYLGKKGVGAWDTLRSNSDFGVGNRERQALESLLACAIENHYVVRDAKRLIHIGPGNGIEIPSIISKLSLHHPDEYWLIDIEMEMAKKSSESQARVFKKTGISPQLCATDVEDNLQWNSIRKRFPKNDFQNVIVATGEGTLLASGTVLKNFADTLGERDIILFNVDFMEGDPQKYCKEYDQISFRKFIFGSLEHGLEMGVIKSLAGSFLPTNYDDKTGLLRCEYFLDEVKKPVLLLETLKPNSVQQIYSFLKPLGLKVVASVQNNGEALGIICKL